jgi:hypothetical protein
MLTMIIISVHVINDRSNVNRTQWARARFVTVGALDYDDNESNLLPRHISGKHKPISTLGQACASKQINRDPQHSNNVTRAACELRHPHPPR